MPGAPAAPRTLRWAGWTWSVIAVLLAAGSAAALLNSSLAPEGERLGIAIIGGAMLFLASFYAYGSIRLLRGSPAGREILTTMGLMGGLPLIIRGSPALTALGLVLLAAVVLVWLPANTAYFRAKKKQARAAAGRQGRPGR